MSYKRSQDTLLWIGDMCPLEALTTVTCVPSLAARYGILSPSSVGENKARCCSYETARRHLDTLAMWSAVGMPVRLREKRCETRTWTARKLGGDFDVGGGRASTDAGTKPEL